jgi:NAD-dependent dihydropyrimidine dehydrogenase PreA subunit
VKSIVIYFSQTRNTEKIAKAIQNGVKQATSHCDILTIKEANPKRLYEYDLIGLGSPIMLKEPPNVTAFISNMRCVGGKHVFSFCTHGAVEVFYHPSVVPRLRKKGLVVIGWNDWYGGAWALDMPTPYATDGHPDEIDLKEAEDWGREMAWRSQRIYAGETSLIPDEPPPPISLPGWADDSDVKHLRYSRILKYDRAKCVYPKCRLCMENCPMDGIDLTVKPYILAKPCMNCGFCLLICPTGAIYTDEKDMDGLCQWIREDMQKYDHQLLANAKARGHFRPLVPNEKIGWTPVYKMYTKRPGFVIGKGRP